MRRLLLLFFVVAHQYVMGQGTSMTLMFEPLESSNDMMWVTQRFEISQGLYEDKNLDLWGVRDPKCHFG